MRWIPRACPSILRNRAISSCLDSGVSVKLRFTWSLSSFGANWPRPGTSPGSGSLNHLRARSWPRSRLPRRSCWSSRTSTRSFLHRGSRSSGRRDPAWRTGTAQIAHTGGRTNGTEFVERHAYLYSDGPDTAHVCHGLIGVDVPDLAGRKYHRSHQTPPAWARADAKALRPPAAPQRR